MFERFKNLKKGICDMPNSITTAMVIPVHLPH